MFLNHGTQHRAALPSNAAEKCGGETEEPTETWRIPSDRQRERLLRGILAGGRRPGVYHLCDLLGWLKDHDRDEEHKAVVAAVLTPTSLSPMEGRRAARA